LSATADDARAQRAAALAAPAEDVDKDLGIGSRVLARSEARFLNPDGSFNVVREGLPFWHSLSLYHWLLTISWPVFFAVVASTYVATNLIFAAAYYACGPDALQGLTEIEHPESRFWASFFFSVHTLATIGYGTLSPRTLPAHVVVTIEALVGLLFFALVTGILFARFSRPTAVILFSRQAVIAPFHEISGLMFRIVNARKSQIVEVQASVSMGWMQRVEGRPVRRFEPLALERKKVNFFPLHWVVVHPIDPASPLFGMTEDELRTSAAEIMVMLTGIDESFSQPVYTRRSYRVDEIVWGARFANIFIDTQDGRVGIDVRKLHDIEPAPLTIERK
jgi:inward rectifier potassium channel